ncbi:mechanosensitive ion channel family protein [Parendozoicomonas haliclonae]|uniref:Small-conductance mechanosensitive channel n=1 Tax=Parendozoicomonas haliclonae TaxID=1960125 RepID=A0A1X7ARN7_9GAMM|nr:Small-conductance mechanosensitive channel [Parendozoicomonas haliclonae]
MVRSVLGPLWFIIVSCLSICPLALAEPTENTQPQALISLEKEKTAVVKQITVTDKQVTQMEQALGKTTYELTRDLIRQQAASDIRRMSDKVNAFIEAVEKDNTPEAKALGIDVVKAESRFFDNRLVSVSKDLRTLFEQYESSEAEQKLLVLFNIDDFYQHINWLMAERQRNLKLLTDWGVDTAASIQALNQEITRYAEFMAGYLRTNARQEKLLQGELDTLPADARSALENKIASQNRLVQSAVTNLKQVVLLMEEQNLPVDQFNELIFQTTGNLAEAVVNIGTLSTIIGSVWEDATLWLQTNIGNIISRLMLFALLILFVVLLARLVRRGISRAVTHKKARFSTLVKDFFISMGGNLVIVFGLLFALAQVGLDLTPLLTGLGVAGIVIGFALQDTLSNFASGMMILIYRPFDVGDFVEAGGVSGKVGKMSLVNTTIRTFDNQVFIVPNAKIWGDTIKNITSERIRRVDMVFGVAYSDNIEQVEKVLEDIVTSHPKILKNPQYMIHLHVLNSSSVDFIVRPWVKTDDYWDVYWDITREVKMRFDREGITIPFPQQDVYLHQISSTTAEKPETPT